MVGIVPDRAAAVHDATPIMQRHRCDGNLRGVMGGNATRIISFLGTTRYTETTYEFDGAVHATQFVVDALATILSKTINIDEIVIIATDEAWSTHGHTLHRPDWNMRRVAIPTSQAPADLWQLFDVIIRELQPGTDDRDHAPMADRPVMFDITHGFRSQPFFAAACIQYMQSIRPTMPAIRVVYGEYRPNDPRSPIWELTTFLDVLGWSRDIMMLLRTGQATNIVNSTNALSSALNRSWALSGRRGPQPQLQRLANCLEQFSGDLTTIRTGSLLIGTPRATASAAALVAALNDAQHDIKTHLPALVPVVDQLRAMAEPLLTDGAELSSIRGQLALYQLAELYRTMGRYSEAISVVREGWITLDAPGAASEPGFKTYDRDVRMAQEKAWLTELAAAHARSVAEVRNDIQHAGFARSPHAPDWFVAQLDRVMTAWLNAIRLRTTVQVPAGAGLAAFAIMRMPVTNAQYRRAVMAGACTAPRDVKAFDDPAKAQHPVVWVTRAQAQAYAAWVGGRLPRDAEWTRAAQGDDGRRWPWGATPPDATRANCRPHGPGTTTPVGSHAAGASPYGLLDMAGNVWQWVADGDHSVRGGAFYCDAVTTEVAARLSYSADTAGYHIGFRVVLPTDAAGGPHDRGATMVSVANDGRTA